MAKKLLKVSEHQRDIFTFWQHGKLEKTAAKQLLGEEMFLQLVAEAETPRPPIRRKKSDGVNMYFTMVPVRKLGKDRRWMGMVVVTDAKDQITYQFQTPLVGKADVIQFMRRVSAVWLGGFDATNNSLLSDIIGGCLVGNDVQLYGSLYQSPWICYSRDPWQLTLGWRVTIGKVGPRLSVTGFKAENKVLVNNRSRIHVAMEWAKICQAISANGLTDPMKTLEKSYA